MKKTRSIAVIELNSIARGIFTSDAMLKQSPVSMIRAGSVHNGKYLIVTGGSVAAVEEAYRRGMIAGGDSVSDSLFLPDVHPDVYNGVFGSRKECRGESLAAVETLTVPAVIKAADAGIKGAEVDIVEIRMADGLGGKGTVIFTGKLEEVETAADIAESILSDGGNLVGVSIIPRPVDETSKLVNASTIFSDSPAVIIKDGES